MTKTSKNPQPYAVERTTIKKGTEKKSTLAGSELEKSKNKSHLNRNPAKEGPFFAKGYPKLERNVDGYDEESDGF